MRRLRDYQRVDIYAGEAAFTARVAAVTGDEARLLLSGPLPAEAGFLPAHCQITFDHGGHLIMLSGMLWPKDPTSVRFVVSDGVRAADKRQHARLNVKLPALVTPIDDLGNDTGELFEAATLDISAGGALLGQGGLIGGSRIRIAIELPGSLGVVDAIARVVRSTDTVTALAFLNLEDDVRARIERFVEQVRDALARRFAEKTATAA